MLKLGLLGRNIQHSQSKKMYEKIYNQSVDYTLIDCDSENEIPTLNEIFQKMSGLSITAPYKKHYLSKLILEEDIKELNAVNCIREENGKFFGTNTDYLAVKEISSELDIEDREVILLGNGSMAKITEIFLLSIEKDYKQFYRSKDGDLTYFNIEELCKTDNPLIINSCARAFSFEGKLPIKSTFWDYNYSHKDHLKKLSERCEYLDGIDLLFRQAVHATKFWNFTL